MDVLHLAQDKWRIVDDEVITYVASLLEIPKADVLGVATFYTMYKQHPIGRHHIEICTNVSCMLRGGEKILARLEEILGIKEGEVSADGLFSIEEAECMGSCGTGPMISIDGKYYENLKPEDLEEILNSYKD